MFSSRMSACQHLRAVAAFVMTVTSAAVAAYFTAHGNRDHLGAGRTLLTPSPLLSDSLWCCS